MAPELYQQFKIESQLKFNKSNKKVCPTGNKAIPFEI